MLQIKHAHKITMLCVVILNQIQVSQVIFAERIIIWLFKWFERQFQYEGSYRFLPDSLDDFNWSATSILCSWKTLKNWMNPKPIELIFSIYESIVAAQKQSSTSQMQHRAEKQADCSGKSFSVGTAYDIEKISSGFQCYGKQSIKCIVCIKNLFQYLWLPHSTNLVGREYIYFQFNFHNWGMGNILGNKFNFR